MSRGKNENFKNTNRKTIGAVCPLDIFGLINISVSIYRRPFNGALKRTIFRSVRQKRFALNGFE